MLQNDAAPHCQQMEDGVEVGTEERWNVFMQIHFLRLQILMTGV